MQGTHMVYLSCCWMTTYRNVISTVPHVIEFTEESLAAFGSMSIHCYAFIFGYMAPGPRWQDHIDIIYKRIHFQSDILPRKLAICAIICIYVDMPQPSQRIFSPLNNIIHFKNNHQFTEIKLSKLSSQAQRVVHWRAALSTSASLKTAISHKVKRRYWCLRYGGRNGLYVQCLVLSITVCWTW